MQFSKALRRFLLGYVILHLVAIAVFVLILTRITRNQMIRDTQSRMSTMATMLAANIDELDEGLNNPKLPQKLTRLGKENDVRLTLVNQDGLVVADSETGTRDIGPHGTRQEILTAKRKGKGFSQRYSSTLDRHMMYFAQRYPEHSSAPLGFVRVAISADSIDASIGSIQRLIYLFAIGAGVLTALLMALFSAQSMKPLSIFAETFRKIGKGKYKRDPRLRNRRDEWGELANAFEQMRGEIADREHRLIENSQRLEAVLSSMIEGVLAIDSRGAVMLANNAACQMFGLPLGEKIHGSKLHESVRIPELREAIEKTQLHRKFSKTEFETLNEPKRKLHARVSVLPNSQHPGVAIVLHDVTELKKLETMRQDFVANVSHELKTPLSSIKAYAETLRLGAINDQKKNLQFVERIESEAVLLEHQIQDLLALARVESGEAAFRITEVSINDVCQDCFYQFETIATDNEIQLNLATSQTSPLVQADPEAVETIFKNLVVNAIHYTPAQGSVTIETAVEDDFAVIRVIDTGIGIALDHQSRIFERFYRVDRARSRDKGGTGLGLAIVKHLTQEFGGHIQLQSQIGKGSTFQIFLPMNNRN